MAASPEGAACRAPVQSSHSGAVVTSIDAAIRITGEGAGRRAQV
jgi:hypothetical protein